MGDSTQVGTLPSLPSCFEGHFMDEPTEKKLSQGDTLEPAGPGLCLLNYQVFPKLEIEADPQDP